jgi:hypothetical protein
VRERGGEILACDGGAGSMALRAAAGAETAATIPGPGPAQRRETTIAQLLDGFGTAL